MMNGDNTSKRKRKRAMLKWILVHTTYLLVIGFLLLGLLATSQKRQGSLDVTGLLTELYALETNSIPVEMDAATYYRRAVQTLDAEDFESVCPTSDVPFTSAWKTDQFPALAEWIREHPQVGDMIDKGSAQEICVGNIFETVDLGPESHLPPPIEKYNEQLFQFEFARLGLSFGERGISDNSSELASAFSILRHFHRSLSLIRPVSANVHERVYLHPLLRQILLSEDVTEQFTRDIVQQLQELDRIAEKSLTKALIRELVLGKFGIHSMYMNPHRTPLLASDPNHMLPRLSFAYQKAKWPLKRSLEQYDHWLALARKHMETPPYSPERHSIEEEIQEARFFDGNLLLQFSTPKFISLSDEDHKANAERRITMILAGLKLHKLKHGAYPTTLKELVPDCLASLPSDSFSTDPFIYKPENDKMIISSHGTQEYTNKFEWNAELVSGK